MKRTTSRFREAFKGIFQKEMDEDPTYIRADFSKRANEMNLKKRRKKYIKMPLERYTLFVTQNWTIVRFLPSQKKKRKKKAKLLKNAKKKKFPP